MPGPTSEVPTYATKSRTERVAQKTPDQLLHPNSDGQQLSKPKIIELPDGLRIVKYLRDKSEYTEPDKSVPSELLAEQRLQGMPCAKPPLEHLQNGKEYHFFMEKAEGKPLFAIPQQTPEQVLEFGRASSSILAQVADRGIVHVDIKEEHIHSIDDGNEWAIIDFDSCVEVNTQRHKITDEYASPESIREPIDSRHDVYSLATVMAERILEENPIYSYIKSDPMLIDYSKTPDFRVAFVQLFIRNPRYLPEYEKIGKALEDKCSSVPGLASVIKQGLNPNKENRPQMEAFAKALEALSPRSKVFPTVKEKQLTEIGSELELGRFLHTFLDSKKTHASGEVSLQEGEYFENTNFSKIGLIMKECERRQPSGKRSETTEAALIELFDNLKQSLQTGEKPDFFLNPGETHGQKLTTLEKESIKIALRIHGLALGRFHYPPYHQALLTYYSLELLKDPVQFLANFHEGGRVSRDLVKGFTENHAKTAAAVRNSNIVQGEEILPNEQSFNIEYDPFTDERNTSAALSFTVDIIPNSQYAFQAVEPGVPGYPIRVNQILRTNTEEPAKPGKQIICGSQDEIIEINAKGVVTQVTKAGKRTLGTIDTTQPTRLRKSKYFQATLMSCTVFYL